MKTKAAVCGIAFALALGIAGGAWGTSVLDNGSSGRQGTLGASFQADDRTVEVVRGDIEVVVAVEAATAAAPSFVLRAPEEGAVEIPSWLDPDEDVDEETALFRLGGDELSVPVSARIEKWLVPDGARVTAGLPVVRLTFSGFGLVGSLPPADAYRLLEGDLAATGRIEGGPSGFECPILRAPPATSGEQGASDAEPREASVAPIVVCAVPPELHAYADVPGQIALRSEQVSDVLTLPVTAVSGSTDVGEVWLDHEGESVVRQVQLGATDGARVEVVDGLEEGDRVRAVPPPLVR